MDSWIPRQAQRAVQDVLQDVHEASVHDVPQRATLVRKKEHVAPTTNACCIKPAEQAAARPLQQWP